VITGAVIVLLAAFSVWTELRARRLARRVRQVLAAHLADTQRWQHANAELQAAYAEYKRAIAAKPEPAPKVVYVLPPLGFLDCGNRIN
jgi:uncharacterized membrane protein YccC